METFELSSRMHMALVVVDILYNMLRVCVCVYYFVHFLTIKLCTPVYFQRVCVFVIGHKSLSYVWYIGIREVDSSKFVLHVFDYIIYICSFL